LVTPGRWELLKDIRDLRDDRDAYWNELRQRWGGLLSYRYIGRKFGYLNTGVTDESVAVRHDFRNAAGGLLVAPLSITCPGGGDGTGDLQTVPNPVVHSCQIVDDGHDVKRIEVDGEMLLHKGRQFSYGRARIVDADNHDRVIALIDSQTTSIGEVPAGLMRFDDDPIDHIEDSPDLPPLWQVFGASKRADGHWQLGDIKAEYGSPDGALHLGPQHVVLETAAIDLAAERVGTDRLQMQTWHVMHLSRGKVGPFRVDGSAFTHQDGSGRVGVQLSLHDEGNGDRAVTGASAVFRVVP
jgi:hypothetical protein